MASKHGWFSTAEAAILGKLKLLRAAAVSVGVGLVAVWVLLGYFGITLPIRLWLVVPIVLVVLHFNSELAVWVHQRRRTLARHATPAPPIKQMAKEMVQHKERVAYVQHQWASYCSENGLTGFGKIVPTLSRIKPNVDLDIVANINPGPIGVNGGLAPFRKKATEIATTCGCPGGVRFRETSIGKGKVTFMWSNLLERELAVSEMPSGPYGRIGYGITDGRAGMSIRMSLAALIVGMSGTGKSKILRDLLIDLKRKGVRTDLYLIDPKRQELSRFAPLVGQRVGSLHVAGYAKTLEACSAMLADLRRILHARQDEMGDVEWQEKHAEKWPLIFVPLDEVYELMRQWKPDPKTKHNPLDDLTTILSQGRSAGVQLVLLSQVAHKEVLGMSRSLIPQRVVLHMESELETGMAFGDTNAEAKGARCSQVHEPGMGWQWVEGEGYLPFRAALPSEDDWNRFLTDQQLPQGMLPAGQVVEQTHFLYRFYTADMQPLRVGETNDFERRYKEYRRNYDKEWAKIEAGVLDPAKALHQWFQFHDHARTVVQECASYAEAKAKESAYIDQGVWRGNHQENMDASLRNVPPPPATPDPRGHWWNLPKQPPAPEGNVTQLRRQPIPPEPRTIGSKRKRTA